MERQLRMVRHAVVAFGAMAIAVTMPAQSAPGANRLHTAPRPGDDYGTWVRNSMRRLSAVDLGSFVPFQDDAVWVQEFLDRPSSIYSDLSPRMFASSGREMSGADDVFPRAASRTAKAMAWDLGLDKALPDYQAPTTQHHIALGRHAGIITANFTKAGVLDRYFQKAYDIGNNNLYTLGAELAVALQVLHEWVEAVPAADRVEMGVYEDVLLRVEAASTLADVTDDDLAYLADILRGELSTWHAGRLNTFGYREIPTPLRIARVAAAYAATQQGYLACKPDGSLDPVQAGTVPEQLGRPICFTDATDRSVYRWYREKRRSQLGAPPSLYGNEGMASAGRIVDAFADIKPSWAGAFAEQALDWSNHAEVIEAQVAAKGDAEQGTDMDFHRLVERANMLICRSAVR